MKAIKEKLEQQRDTSQYRVKWFSLSAHTYYYGNIRCDISLCSTAIQHNRYRDAYFLYFPKDLTRIY